MDKSRSRRSGRPTTATPGESESAANLNRRAQIEPSRQASCCRPGGIAFPGAFLAKALIERLPVHVHTVILDAVVASGGAVMIANAFMR